MGTSPELALHPIGIGNLRNKVIGRKRGDDDAFRKISKLIVGIIVIASGRTVLLFDLKRIFSCAEIRIQACGQRASTQLTAAVYGF
jgi:hypothetical protein